MQVGSLVERVVDPVYVLDEYGRPVPLGSDFSLVPMNTPVLIIGWKYANKWDNCMFMFELEGYQGWYNERILRELQPPMDMAFLEEMQFTNVDTLLPILINHK
jgi:hypothetical protein